MTTSSKTPPLKAGTKGFALVATLSVTALLVILVISLLSLSMGARRVSASERAAAEAKANARLSLLLALGSLQKQMGPDQRVSARADIAMENPPNPMWTGVWRTDMKDPSPVWLVSGDGVDPGTALNDSNSARLHSPPPGSSTTSVASPVRVPLGKVAGKPNGGRMAWWVADEGIKAAVDLAPAEAPAANNLERLAVSRSPLASAIHALGGDFPKELLGRDGTFDRSKILSLDTLGLAAGNVDVPRRYFNDLTTGGYGLPVDVKDGGFKTDLSLVFDRAAESSPFVAATLGAAPGPVGTFNGTTVHQFNSITKPADFYLSPSLLSNVPAGVGPNWGMLFNYARLWQFVDSSQSMGCLAPYNAPTTNLRYLNWRPYTAADAGDTFSRDRQNRSGAVSPVVSLFQFGLYFGAKREGTDASGNALYRTQLLMKPTIGFWNPSNVTLRSGNYIFEWALYPFLQIRHSGPGVVGAPGTVTQHWLREYWGGGNALPDNRGTGGRWFRLSISGMELQPGEFRLYSTEGRQTHVTNTGGLNTQEFIVRPTWDPNGFFTLDLNNLALRQGSQVWCDYATLQDSHWPGTRARWPSMAEHFASTWVTFRNAGASTTGFAESTDAGGYIHRITNLWNGTWDESANRPLTPEPITTSGGRRHLVERLVDSPEHIGTWRWQIRNSTESDEPGQGLRGWIDSNPFALVTSPRFDGSSNNAQGIQGWHAAAQMTPGTHRITGAGDGLGGNRGLVAVGAQGSPQPQGDIRVANRWRGFGGPGSTAANGFTHVIARDIPRSPLVSLGQFQHALLSRYNFEPAFVVGNSYANPRIPLDRVVTDNFANQGTNMPGFKLVDTSYEVNERLWDRYFFSTLGRDYLGLATGTLDSAFGFQNLARGIRRLPNPRMAFMPFPGDTSLDRILSEAGLNAPRAMAARIATRGAFNVNSTSVEAWMAVLGSMEFSELPTINPLTGAVSWQKTDGIRFSRFGHPASPVPTSGTSRDAAFWQGWRQINETELRQLAEAIVAEVKSRGPFLSFADFVNRDPESDKVEHRRKGALQAALDTAINNKISATIAFPANNPPGSRFSEAISGENQATGHASYLLQGDLLQNLAPILQARSDTFRIRAYGEVPGPNGQVLARAHCEAMVRRTAAYLEPGDRPEALPKELTSVANRNFGRRFEIVSFRWLSPEEL